MTWPTRTCGSQERHDKCTVCVQIVCPKCLEPLGPVYNVVASTLYSRLGSGGADGSQHCSNYARLYIRYLQIENSDGSAARVIVRKFSCVSTRIQSTATATLGYAPPPRARHEQCHAPTRE